MKKIVLSLLIVFQLSLFAKCDISTGLDLIARVCYDCMLPLKIGAVPVAYGTMIDASVDISSVPICLCPLPPPIYVRPGIPLSFFIPDTVIESVSDPMCFPSIGVDLGSIVTQGTLGGGDATKGEQVPRTFMQSHKLIFPLMKMLALMTDVICLQNPELDIAFLTEIDPSWNSEIIAAFLHPEGILFGNPVAALTCSADAIAASANFTLDPLFWCKGSHGMAYPMTGTVQSKGFVEDSASIAENLIYHLHRIGLGTTNLMCMKMPTSIWKKSDYRLQILKPIPHFTGFTVGRSGLLWGYGKNVPFMGDNFVYLIFKKFNCCAL